MNEIYTLGGRRSSGYDYRINPVTKRPEFHAGVDYPAPAGTPIPSAAPGTVVYSGKNEGFGNTVIVRNLTGDYSLYAHMQDGDRVKPGQKVLQGDTIRRVGSTGKYTTGPHLHYSVIKKEAGADIEKSGKPRDGGPIGIHLGESNTYNPSTYRNYVPPPPEYLDESRRIEQIMSGMDKSSPLNGDTPFVDSRLFETPFDKSVSPGSRAPDQGRRSEIPGHVTQDAAQWTAGYDSAPVRVLSRLNVSPALPSSDVPPLTPAAAPPLLGIFSGKPMPDYPVWPSIFNTNDRSSSDDDELYQHWRRWLEA